METGNLKTRKPAPSTKAGSTPAPGKVINWAGVKKVYCGSNQSTREIGKAFGVSHTMVAKHATAHGWQRPAKEEKAKPAPKPRARPPAVPAAPVVAEGLEPRQQRFVDEYLIDLNGTQAAIRAGYSSRTASEQSYDLLRRPHIAAAIAAGQAALQDRTQVTAARVVQEIALIALADPRELIEAKVGCCRYCWGTDFKRQRTQVQRDADFERWRPKAKDGEEFDEEGGTGFNPHRAPHPDCIECCGDGVSRDVIKDTRYLSPSAVALYAGVKRTKDGIEVKMQDKGAALERLARHLGIFEKDNGQRNDPLALRSMSDTERAVRMSAILQANPGLVAMFGQLTGGGEPQ